MWTIKIKCNLRLWLNKQADSLWTVWRIFFSRFYVRLQPFCHPDRWKSSTSKQFVIETLFLCCEAHVWIVKLIWANLTVIDSRRRSCGIFSSNQNKALITTRRYWITSHLTPATGTHLKWTVKWIIHSHAMKWMKHCCRQGYYYLRWKRAEDYLSGRGGLALIWERMRKLGISWLHL